MNAARLVVASVCAARLLFPLASGAAGGRPTLDDLRGATVIGIAREPITLEDGSYESDPFDLGGASRLRVSLSSHRVAFGEIDGVPGDEAVGLLSASGGGSGTLVYVAAFQKRGDQLTNTGTVLVGDRVTVRDLDIVGSMVTIDVVEAGPGDALCCPSQLARKLYAFRDTALTLVSSVVTGTLSLAPLAGREWTLLSIDDESLPQGAQAPTVTFEGARISGFAGCNRYTGQIEETIPGAISLGPLAATMMACPSPAMEIEDRYLAALGTVSRYTVAAGRLLLSGRDGRTPRLLTFEHAP